MASRVYALIGKWKWKSFSRVWLFVTTWTVHGILQARILGWLAFPFFRGSSQPRDGTQSLAVRMDSLPAKPQGKPKNTGVGRLFLLQRIFPTQGSNPDLLHYRQILYQLSHKGSPRILKWVAYPFSRVSFRPRNWTRVSCIAGGFFTNGAIRVAPFIYL